LLVNAGKEALQKAAHRCEVVLALVSPEWLASGWCSRRSTPPD
jgi:hypothetical protein